MLPSSRSTLPGMPMNRRSDSTTATKKNPLTDADRFALLMSMVAGKRLTYVELTGKGTDTVCQPEAGTGEEEPF